MSKSNFRGIKEIEKKNELLIFSTMNSLLRKNKASKLYFKTKLRAEKINFKSLMQQQKNDRLFFHQKVH